MSNSDDIEVDVSQHNSLADEDPESKLLGNDSRPANLFRAVLSGSDENPASPLRRSIRCERLLVIGLIVTVIMAATALTAVFVGRNDNDSNTNTNENLEGTVEPEPPKLSISDLMKLCPVGANTFSSSQLPDEIVQRGGDFAAMLSSEVSGDLTPYSCSPSNLSVLYLAANHLPETLNQHTLLLRYILTTFYFSLGGTKWRESDNWLSDDGECTWHGITCNENGEITELVLTHNNLLGPLPDDLHFLSSLQVLRLSQNSITGTFPASLTRLPHLAELEFSLNSFTGTVPADIWKQTQLRILGLTRFGGSLNEVPTEIGLFSNLERFVAPDSNIMGTLPTELGRCGSLKFLDLSYNQLDSTIPTHLGALRELQTLYLSGNAFEDGDGDETIVSFVVPNEVCTLLNTGRLLAFDLKAECPITEQM
mmetsp:Transcript_7114/g.11814  ORF Transcript_7114/g.11814 Transcript_7114/m.11814 type:complete len:423 (-) Transcript_7114:537-1805(-)|eukprot:CAMPEP_0119020568 /NCGR_PEP_ID=MMETSP1176-20130426/24322_1 /TAXON_ID=265551 /ORGANISM="Synedropsis recta cf, Strain CCMP1620" /LENGTH=422 /DNA_ID=CAMNT_0006975021 /DNA_START=447 /DNA_END=1715 /DNA_ORIENTATION=+